MSAVNPYNPPAAEVNDVNPASRGTTRLQVKRLSPHQNGKVFGVLFGLVSLVFILPFVMLAAAFSPQTGLGNMGIGFFLFFPLIYLVMGYITTAIGCGVYNMVYKFVGGIEYDAEQLAR